MSLTTLIVLRTAGERTIEVATKAALMQGAGAFVAIRERPFLKACERTFAEARRLRPDVLVALDADVVLGPDALKRIVARLEAEPRLFRLDCRVVDKFRGELCAGCHAYRPPLACDLCDLCDPGGIEECPARGAPMYPCFDELEAEFWGKTHSDKRHRVESSIVMAYARSRGLECGVLKDPAGLHDFGQYIKHVKQKYWNRSQREGKNWWCVYAKLEAGLQAHMGDLDWYFAEESFSAGKGKGTSCTDAAEVEAQFGCSCEKEAMGKSEADGLVRMAGWPEEGGA